MANVNLSGNTEQQEMSSIKRNSKIEQIKGMTDAQIVNYVNTNVTDLASAREHIMDLTRIVAFMIRRLGKQL